MVFPWKEDYKLGIDMIDWQHRKLVEILNRLVRINLSETMTGDPKREEISAVFGELIDYTRYHFREEEALFEDLGYSRSEQHRLQHRALLARLLMVKGTFDDGGRVTPLMQKFLETWLFDHIFGDDREYAEEFRERDLLRNLA